MIRKGQTIINQIHVQIHIEALFATKNGISRIIIILWYFMVFQFIKLSRLSKSALQKCVQLNLYLLYYLDIAIGLLFKLLFEFCNEFSGSAPQFI